MHADMSPARRLWHAVEPLHAVVYFAPETVEGLRALGLRGFWMGYFASRSAPMGAVGPDAVAAAFSNFHPAMVRRALPDAWSYARPEDVLACRMDTAVTALRRMLGPNPPTVSSSATGGSKPPTVSSSATRGAELLTVGALAQAAAGARAACENLECGGRPLAAAWAAVPWPGEPLADLWLAATILREHRGDGHVAALVGAEVDGCAAHVLAAAGGLAPRATLQPHRGWSDDDWAQAAQRLRARGWLDAGDSLTAEGAAARAEIERRTDALAMAPLRALGAERATALIAALEPLAAAVRAAEGVPFPNPMGLPAPPPA